MFRRREWPMQEEQEQMEDMDPDQDLMWQLNRSCSLRMTKLMSQAAHNFFLPAALFAQ